MAVAAVGWVGLAGRSRGVSGSGLPVRRRGTGAGLLCCGRVPRAEVRQRGAPEGAGRPGGSGEAGRELARRERMARGTAAPGFAIYIYIYVGAGRAGSVGLTATPEVRTEPQDACAVPKHAAAFPGRGRRRPQLSGVCAGAAALP